MIYVISHKHIDINRGEITCYIGHPTEDGGAHIVDDPACARKFSNPADAYCMINSWTRRTQEALQPRLCAWDGATATTVEKDR